MPSRHGQFIGIEWRPAAVGTASPVRAESALAMPAIRQTGDLPLSVTPGRISCIELFSERYS
jgi:hypothetical protein